MVKMHDRVGRMADTLEFSHVAFPVERFSDELLTELHKTHLFQPKHRRWIRYHSPSLYRATNGAV